MKELVLSGVSASEGMVAGILVQCESESYDFTSRETGNSDHEKHVLRKALNQARSEISNLTNGLDQTTVEIMELQLALLDDEDFLAPAFISINQGMSAHKAWNDMMDAEITDYATTDDSYMAARADDLRDLRGRVLGVIFEKKSTKPLPTYGKNIIIATCQITPSEFLKFDSSSLSAIVVSGGSSSSHVAILARARGIPMMVGCDNRLLRVPSGSTALIDTEADQIIINPRKPRLIKFQRKFDQYQNMEDQANKLINEPAFTGAGDRITIYANVDSLSLLSNIDVTPFDGVGLTRTEFLFQDGNLPSEDEQFNIYCSILNWGGGRPVTIRTLDRGGDKSVPGVMLEGEDSSFLGLRGYRLSQANNDLFKTQLRALARAATLGPLKVMIPMVTIPSEMEQFKKFFANIVTELKSEGVACAQPPLGMMIEVPAAALEAESFNADFYSIGSNDLVQYTLAVARDDLNVNYLVDYRNPAVLKLIEIAVKAADRQDAELSICGDMASTPEFIHVLIDIGVRVFSVAIPNISKVKQSVRQWGRSTDE